MATPPSDSTERIAIAAFTYGHSTGISGCVRTYAARQAAEGETSEITAMAGGESEVKGRLKRAFQAAFVLHYLGAAPAAPILFCYTASYGKN